MKYLKRFVFDRYIVAYGLVCATYTQLSSLFNVYNNLFYFLILLSIFFILLYFIYYKKLKPKYVIFLNIFLLFIIIILTIYEYTLLFH